MPRPCCAARESSCTCSGETRPGRAAQSAKIIGSPVSRFHSRPRSRTCGARTSKPRSPMTRAPLVPLARASPSTAGSGVNLGWTPISSRTSFARTCEVREAVSRKTSSQMAGDCSPARTTVWTGPSAPMARPGTISYSPSVRAPTETRARSTSPASSIAAQLEGSARTSSMRVGGLEAGRERPGVQERDGGGAELRPCAAPLSRPSPPAERGRGERSERASRLVDLQDAVVRVALGRDRGRRRG